MIVRVFPAVCEGSVTIPPSKSMAHRAIICASLAQGKSRIDNIVYSKDIIATIEGMRALGAEIIAHDDFLEIDGVKDLHACPSQTVFCNESGSTLRFLIPIFSLTNQRITFTGKGRLLQRPQSIYEKLFKDQRLYFYQDRNRIIIEGCLEGGDYTLAGDISSQFISGLLFALPLCQDHSTLFIKEPFESRSYVALTMQMLDLFGIEAQYRDANTIDMKGRQSYHAGCVNVEGDYSQFAFFACLAALNHDLDIMGVGHLSRQGDRVILDILRTMGVAIEEIVGGYHVAQSMCYGCEIDLSDCPDLGPILCVMAAFSHGVTHIKNAQRLRMKESDRITAMESELRKLGVAIRSTDSDIYIEGKPFYEGDVLFNGHNDHRIVMSLAIASTLCEKPCKILDAQAVEKSYPQFFDDLANIGIEVEHYA